MILVTSSRISDRRNLEAERANGENGGDGENEARGESGEEGLVGVGNWEGEDSEGGGPAMHHAKCQSSRWEEVRSFIGSWRVVFGQQKIGDSMFDDLQDVSYVDLED
jgi:hypothetical protein